MSDCRHIVAALGPLVQAGVPGWTRWGPGLDTLGAAGRHQGPCLEPVHPGLCVSLGWAEGPGEGGAFVCSRLGWQEQRVL